MKAGLAVIGIGALFALLAVGGYYTSGAPLAAEEMRLDTTRANIDSSSGSGAYRIDLEHLERGQSVTVAWTFLDRVNGTLTFRLREGLDGKVAPPPSEGALLRVDGEFGNVTFVAEEAAEYALVVEGDGETPKGRLLLSWDPSVEPGRNPVFLGAARTSLVLSLPLGAALMGASWLRRRRNPLR